MLYRLDSLAERAVINQEGVVAGLTTHLRYGPLTSLLVRIGRGQRAYVALAGCAGCRLGRCQLGCPTDLLRRMLRAHAPGVTMTAVPKGLASRPYTEIAIAWSTAGAAPLDAGWLTDWPDARLQLQYAAGAHPRVLALVAVGSEGPPLLPALRARGWRALPVHPRVGAHMLRQMRLPVVPHARLTHPPALLLPGALAQEIAPSHSAMPHPDDMPIAPVLGAPAHRLSDLQPSTSIGLLSAAPRSDQPRTETETPPPVLHSGTAATEDLSSRLLADLCAMLAGEAPFRRIVVAATAAAGGSTQVAADEAAVTEPSPFPHGPGTGKSAMPPRAVEEWVHALIDHPQGHTRKTIAALLGEAHKEHAATLLRWLDAARLLGAATDPTQPYRYPRALLLSDHALIADRLRATPLPEMTPSTPN
jgi:hypothetical protein